ncbi:transposase [Pseudomonas brenneri]|uniref:transposase n=1 Tax=Pseudomonas brenneri TaxID=129817 RepID=UPI0035710808
MQPTRRSYSKSFKAQVIQECAQPGASIAGVALSHSLNANLVHKWIRVHAHKSSALLGVSFQSAPTRRGIPHTSEQNSPWRCAAPILSESSLLYCCRR